MALKAPEPRATCSAKLRLSSRNSGSAVLRERTGGPLIRRMFVFSGENLLIFRGGGPFYSFYYEGDRITPAPPPPPAPPAYSFRRPRVRKACAELTPEVQSAWVMVSGFMVAELLAGFHGNGEISQREFRLSLMSESWMFSNPKTRILVFSVVGLAFFVPQEHAFGWRIRKQTHN